MMPTATTNQLETLQQHELVILRRLRKSPLTEFELCSEIAEHSGYTVEQCADQIEGWLEVLCKSGLIWHGELTNSQNQFISAAALTQKGRELVG